MSVPAMIQADAPPDIPTENRCSRGPEIPKANLVASCHTPPSHNSHRSQPRRGHILSGGYLKPRALTKKTKQSVRVWDCEGKTGLVVVSKDHHRGFQIENLCFLLLPLRELVLSEGDTGLNEVIINPKPQEFPRLGLPNMFVATMGNHLKMSCGHRSGFGPRFVEACVGKAASWRLTFSPRIMEGWKTMIRYVHIVQAPSVLDPDHSFL